VVAKIKLHKGLCFRNEDPKDISKDGTILSKNLGNVNEDTEFTFEYTLQKIKKLARMKDIDLTKITHFPF